MIPKPAVTAADTDFERDSRVGGQCCCLELQRQQFIQLTVILTVPTATGRAIKEI